MENLKSEYFKYVLSAFVVFVVLYLGILALLYIEYRMAISSEMREAMRILRMGPQDSLAIKALGRSISMSSLLIVVWLLPMVANFLHKAMGSDSIDKTYILAGAILSYLLYYLISVPSEGMRNETYAILVSSDRAQYMLIATSLSYLLTPNRRKQAVRSWGVHVALFSVCIATLHFGVDALHFTNGSDEFTILSFLESFGIAILSLSILFSVITRFGLLPMAGDLGATQQTLPQVEAKKSEKLAPPIQVDPAQAKRNRVFLTLFILLIVVLFILILIRS